MEGLQKIKIECRNITKNYNLYGSASDKLKLFFMPNQKPQQFSALTNVNLTCYDGEIVGMIGVNGSGKSTLSSIIAGVTFPDSGDLIVNGKVNKLAVNSGLDSHLTGRENIKYKCLLMGMTKAHIAEISQQIIDFADLGVFIDQPIKTYSSGMKSRLGFGISVQLDPDILVIDEALSVGDGSFKQRCADKIYEFKNNKKTIIFVSHSLSEMKHFCDKVLWLHKGNVIGFGKSEEILEAYGKFTKEFAKLDSDSKKAFLPALSRYTS